jgi:hypothetical protein
MQTGYQIAPSAALPGMKYDLSESRTRTGKNSEGAALPFGVGVTKGANAGEVEYPDAAGDVVIGISQFQADVNPGLLVGGGIAVYPDTTAGVSGYPDAAIMSVLDKGRIYVIVEADVVEGDVAFCRHTANGAGKLQLGAFRKDADSGNAARVYGARFVAASSSVTINGATVKVAPISFDVDANESAVQALADEKTRADAAYAPHA